jgi:hypothetical protein
MDNHQSPKTIIALSDAFDDRPSAQLNALGHLAQSIGHQAAHRHLAQYTRYHDATGTDLGILSWWPLIVLSGRPQKIKQAWSELQAHDWPKACFVETMIEGGSEAQLVATSDIKFEDAKVVAIATFGPSEALNFITKRLSLWRSPTRDGQSTHLRSA